MIATLGRTDASSHVPRAAHRPGAGDRDVADVRRQRHGDHVAGVGLGSSTATSTLPTRRRTARTARLCEMMWPRMCLMSTCSRVASSRGHRAPRRRGGGHGGRRRRGAAVVERRAGRVRPGQRRRALECRDMGPPVGPRWPTVGRPCWRPTGRSLGRGAGQADAGTAMLAMPAALLGVWGRRRVRRRHADGPGGAEIDEALVSFNPDGGNPQKQLGSADPRSPRSCLFPLLQNPPWMRSRGWLRWNLYLSLNSGP